MHFLDAWAGLSLPELLRLAVPTGLLIMAALLPGRRAARVSALGVGLALPFLGGLVDPWPLRVTWAVLWLLLAREVGELGVRGRTPAGMRLGAAEAAVVSLLLAPALAGLLIAAIARLDLPGPETRRATFGLLAVCLGLLHLMLRRHAQRSAIAFATLGLGLQVIDGVARTRAAPAPIGSQAAILLAAALAVALSLRLARGRESEIGTAWVGDAHDLHD